MKVRIGLIHKLICFFIMLLLSILAIAGVSTYYSQRHSQTNSAESNLQNLVRFLSNLMESDGEEFQAFQALSLKYSSRVDIPADFSGDYHPAKNQFYQEFNATFPGKVLGQDIAYEDMPENLKILFVKYKQEYWLHIFDKAKKDFGAVYAYYVVPTGKKLHMYYLLDAVQEARKDDPRYLHLNIDVYQDMKTHAHMWKAWENSGYTPGHDTQDNEFGKTYICYYPLVINGTKMGVVAADVLISHVDNTILDNTLRQMVGLTILILPFLIIIAIRLEKAYIRRLIRLRAWVGDFSRTKEENIAEKIQDNIKTSDEIADLSGEIANMIHEICKYTQSLIHKNRELLEAQDKIRAANELASKDSLTGIRNKTAYDLEAKKVEERIQKGEKKLGIAIVDLNFLKKINDTYGHEKGNLAIKKLCFTICHIFQHSPVFRIGGDEFAIFLSGGDYDNYDALSREFYRQTKQLQKDPSLEPWDKISAAIGVAYFDPGTDSNVEDMFKRADANMYQQKKSMKAARE